MHPPFFTRRPVLTDAAGASNEGRDSVVSQRITALLLFPRLDGRPGGWLLVLAAACTYVAVRALELGTF